jgi:hypothetical protein
MIFTGIAGLSIGAFRSYIYRRDWRNWRLASGLLVLVIGLLLYLWGLNMVFAHVFCPALSARPLAV